MPNLPVTCEIRYRIDHHRIAEFEEYARTWTKLIARHGGIHHGYFLPRQKPTEIAVSFPGVGEEGADDIAVALFSFPDEASYLRYRERVATEADGLAANERFGQNPPFISYERTFLRPVPTTG